VKRDIYYLFLGIFILYVAFSAFEGGEDNYVNWYPMNQEMKVTIQYYFWMLFMRVAMFLIFLSWYFESREENRKMLKVLAIIHLWYLAEYILHYTSVWVVVLPYAKYSGLSSHILTMSAFAYFGRD